jgi:ubiquinone/menaquinone biosynthesis C-methylase UbiE
MADVTQMSFPSSSFDVVTSFETIEHVDANRYLSEIERVLKPGGLLVLSTPQSCLGHIPANPHHEHEFSFEQLKETIATRLDVKDVIVIKQGRVVSSKDNYGTNTFLVAQKKLLVGRNG